jgi:hypothetical protein
MRDSSVMPDTVASVLCKFMGADYSGRPSASRDWVFILKTALLCCRGYLTALAEFAYTSVALL